MRYFVEIFVLQHTDQNHTGWSLLNKFTAEIRFNNNLMIGNDVKLTIQS